MKQSRNARKKFNQRSHKPAKGPSHTEKSMQQVTAGPFQMPVEVSKNGGPPQQLMDTVRVVATNQTRILPGNGPESVLWNVDIVSLGLDRIVPYQQGLTHDQMSRLMLEMQLTVLGRNINPSEATAEDRKFIKTQKSQFPRNNILNRLQIAKPHGSPAASPPQRGPRQ